MVAYLLMPRPKDLVKGLLIPITYVLGLLGGGEVSGASLLRAVVARQLERAVLDRPRAAVRPAGDDRPPGGADRGAGGRLGDEFKADTWAG
jgi:hypothetical protein